MKRTLWKNHITPNILAFTLTQGNVNDRKPAPQVLKDIFGKIFSDKVYGEREVADSNSVALTCTK